MGEEQTWDGRGIERRGTAKGEWRGKGLKMVEGSGKGVGGNERLGEERGVGEDKRGWERDGWDGRGTGEEREGKGGVKRVWIRGGGRSGTPHTVT